MKKNSNKVISIIFLIGFSFFFIGIIANMVAFESGGFNLFFVLVPFISIFLMMIAILVYSIFFGNKNNGNNSSVNIEHSEKDFMVSGKKIEKKLNDLEYLLNRNLISKDEYEENRKKILSEVE